MSVKSKIIDLRSDTVTIPSEGMYSAIKNASCEDSFLDRDRSTANLEKKCADLFGFEKAVFLVSGTMANQLAIKAHTNIGDEIITDYSYHVNYYESVAVSKIAAVHMNIIHTSDGLLTADKLEYFIECKNVSKYSPILKLICLENSINYHSGKIFPINKLKEVAEFARKNALSVHLDGARIINSAIEEKLPLFAYAQVADSMMFSFIKGLGAPFGAVLMGGKDFIDKVRKYNKWHGGGMHQSGLMAECALYALENNIKDISSDNNKAKLLYQHLLNTMICGVHIPKVETNIIMLDLNKSGITARELINFLEERNIKLYMWSKNIVRAVTHRDINEDEIKYAAEIITEAIFSLKKNDNISESIKIGVEKKRDVL